MTARYLRIVFLSEFLVAVLAIFTAWSEIGGQAVLDAMPWGWKAGLGLGLAAIFVAFTASLVAGESIWNSRSTKWLALMIAVALAMGVVTFYYTVQLENQPPDEQDGSSAFLDRGAGTRAQCHLVIPKSDKVCNLGDAHSAGTAEPSTERERRPNWRHLPPVEC